MIYKEHDHFRYFANTPCLFSKLSYSPASSRQVYDMTMT